MESALEPPPAGWLGSPDSAVLTLLAAIVSRGQESGWEEIRAANPSRDREGAVR